MGDNSDLQIVKVKRERSYNQPVVFFRGLLQEFQRYGPKLPSSARTVSCGPPGRLSSPAVVRRRVLPPPGGRQEWRENGASVFLTRPGPCFAADKPARPPDRPLSQPRWNGAGK